jgi:hypothetical protein
MVPITNRKTPRVVTTLEKRLFGELRRTANMAVPSTNTMKRSV